MVTWIAEFTAVLFTKSYTLVLLRKYSRSLRKLSSPIWFKLWASTLVSMKSDAVSPPQPMILELRKEGAPLLFEFERHMKTGISGVRELPPALSKLPWGLAAVDVPATIGYSLWNQGPARQGMPLETVHSLSGEISWFGGNSVFMKKNNKHKCRSNCTTENTLKIFLFTTLLSNKK